MDEQQKKSHVWHRTAAALVALPVLYVLSFTPVYWLTAHGYFLRESTVSSFYRPILWSAVHAPWLEKVIPAAVSSAYAATIVWLVVRFINRREWWAKAIALVLISFPPFYVLSYAAIYPWIFNGSKFTGIPSDYLRMCLFCFYAPLMAALDAGPREIRDAVEWLMGLLH